MGWRNNKLLQDTTDDLFFKNIVSNAAGLVTDHFEFLGRVKFHIVKNVVENYELILLRKSSDLFVKPRKPQEICAFLTCFDLFEGIFGQSFVFIESFLNDASHDDEEIIIFKFGFGFGQIAN